MLTPKEMAVVWSGIQESYKKTMELSPKETIDSILETFKMEDVLETFSAVTKIKKGDGRIWHTNRAWMESIPVLAECYDWEKRPMNEFLRMGFDNIHTTHIDQMITELYRRNKEVTK